MRILVWLIVAALPLLGQAQETATASRRPNVIVILTDDQGWGDLSLNGNTNLSTPNIDAIGREGARFDRFFVCPVCSPTRAEFLTGRYHPRGGVYSTSTGGERLDLDERTIAELFKAAGYRTGAFGKWHNGSQFPYHPLARGFDEYYGFTSGHWGDYFSPPLEDDGLPTTGNGYLPDDLTDHALQFVQHNQKRPFFLYLPFNTPHSPMQVPDKWYDKVSSRELAFKGDDKEDLNFTRAALAMVENIDWNVGRVMAKLKELEIDDQTIVLFFCDNGPNSSRWNGGMKGRKGSTDEGGVRSPLLVRWPGRIAPNRLITQISGAIDLLPTLTDLANVPVLDTHPVDGRSLRGLLEGQAPALPERTLFSTWSGKVSARNQQFRLDDRGQLYDMTTDPAQSRDVSDKFPQVAQEMREQVDAWRRDVLAERGPDKRPFPIGHRDSNLTQLPARDGQATGQVERSAKAPNCSYFTKWSSTDDTINWSVDVLNAGTY
ncbi:MAG: arylsulfatase, partial [Pirellulaceae bacterium]|nr:arylsulfatase [Pirellulaceae bacterium]